MAAIRGNLTDPTSAASVPVEGTIDESEGVLEFTDADVILQAVLEGRTLRLTTDDGTSHDVKLGEVSPSETSGTSRAAFSTV